MTLRDAYLETARAHLDALPAQFPALDQAAALVLDAVGRRRRTYLFGSGHSAMLAQELVARAGGLVFFNLFVVPGLQITDHPLRSGELERTTGVAATALAGSELTEGDVLLVVSNSGRNAVPLEMAMGARERGVRVVAVTSVPMSSAAPSRHPSGLRLFEVADVVLDTGVPPGDAAVPVPGGPLAIGPVSTVVGAALLQLLACTVAQRMLDAGQAPPVLPSANVDGAGVLGQELLAQYADLVTYGLD